MQPSVFNVRVPLANRDDVFLMNTLTDAQLIVSPDVVDLLDRMARPAAFDAISGEERETVALLEEHGFLVADRQSDQHALDRYFARVTSDSSELHITVLTTLQCNFACDYCFQGDHGDYNKFAEKMTLETAMRTAEWVEREMDRQSPEHVTLMFFGGEPLLNLPVMYYLAERLHASAETRGIDLGISIITNGMLLTPEVVDRLLPFGLRGVKITLDGDKQTPRPDAAAPRRTGHFRSHRPEHPGGRQPRGRVDWRQLRRNERRQLPGAARFPARAGVRRQAGQGELQAGRSRSRAECVGGARRGSFRSSRFRPTAHRRSRLAAPA